VTANLAIEAKDLTKSFDGKRAVHNIDISVSEGIIYGILGPDGAGKTTTLRMLLGIIEPDAGHRSLLGHKQLKALIDGGAGIEELSIERPGLHDAFVAIAGEAAARAMSESAGYEMETLA
jgi:ABC-2 type transport system ATP-binding protein